MTAIWQNDGTRWRLLAPAGFPDEAALHGLVEQAPHILPLAGDPRLVVVGREVLLGGNWADLIAVETSGRLAIIELKLAKNAEARRAVVAQILTYAAYLRGMDPVTLERDVLGPHLQQRGYPDLAEAVRANDQEHAFDGEIFRVQLADGLRTGRFRLVLVLDEAPPELVRLVGYLEAVTDQLLIDLIAVSSYEIGDSQVVIPRRVDLEREPAQMPPPSPSSLDSGGGLVAGEAAFVATIDQAAPDQQPLLRRLVEWAVSLEAEGLVTLSTYHGKSGRTTLLPRLRGEGVGLATIWNDNGAQVTLYRSVFERSAPTSLARIEPMLNPPKIGQGTYARPVTEALLAELTQAYREAAGNAAQPRRAEASMSVRE